MTREVSTVTAAKRLGVSASTVLNWLRTGRLAGRRGDQPLRQRWYVTVDDNGHPLALDGTRMRAAGEDSSIVEELRLLRAVVERTERLGTANEVALRLKAAGERQRRALELQAEAINELAAALQEQGEAIAQLLLPDTVAQFTGESEAASTP